MNLALAGMMPSGCQDKKKRKGLVIKATITTVSRIIVIHEFYYVFLSVSACFLTDLKSWQYVALIDHRSTEQGNTCVLSRSHVSRLFPKKKIVGLVVQLNEDTVQAKSSMLVVRSVIGYIVSYGIEVSNGNSNTQSTILKNWVRGLDCVSSSFPVIIISFLNSFSTGSEIISQKVFACLSRQYSLLLNAKAPKSCMASLYLACVASVSNQVIARKLERKRHSFFFALVPAF